MNQSLLNLARQRGNPVIDGEKATFLWEGQSAPSLIDDLHGWDANPQPFKRLARGMYACSFDLPADSYLEYSLLDPRTKVRIPDPLNRRRIWNGINAYNHFFYMPDAGPTPLVRRTRGADRGTVTRHRVEAQGMVLGSKRDVYLYKPPTDAPVPLLVVFDGPDYLRRGKLSAIVDNLIAQERIHPLAMALIQNGGLGRMVEYACSETTLAFIVAGVIPLASREMNILDIEKHPGAYGLLGASMGGLISVYTALRLPQIFGRALSQAGAFTLWEHETIAMQMVRHMPRPPVKLWLDCGRMDFLRDSNLSMQALLRESGYDMIYFENGGAHNFTTWRDCVWRGLETLFGQS
ncbi:MAG: alpha/beta hydrolase-fold protein [Chloroflexota bacterium]